MFSDGKSSVWGLSQGIARLGTSRRCFLWSLRLTIDTEDGGSLECDVTELYRSLLHLTSHTLS